MDASKLKNILEAGLLVAGRTLSIAQLEALFQQDEDKPERKQIREALESLKADYEGRGIELVEVASGYRLQSHASVSDWVANLFQEKQPRYSRALLETLVLIAYRQPITRAEIEDVRGVAVSSNIIKTLQERQWVKVLGHKEVPGRPALLGTSKEFLDYFNLKKLDDLPELADIKDLDQFDALLAEEIGDVDEDGGAANDEIDQPSGGKAAKGPGVSLSTSNDASEGEGDTSSEGSPTDNPENDEVGDGGGDQQAGDQQAGEQQARSDDAASDDAASANIDLGAAPESDVEDVDNTLSKPERDLIKVIADFSDEHQEEIDARDEMEERILSKNTDDDAPEVGDLSQRIGDDGSGDMPEPGDTLH